MSEENKSRWLQFLRLRTIDPTRTADAAGTTIPVTVPLADSAPDVGSDSAHRASIAGLPLLSCELPHHAASVRAARHAAKPVLACWGLDQETVDDVLLVVSELVTNAIE